MSNEAQIQAIEKDMTAYRKQIDLRESFVSLSNNRHFKAVISEGYFKDEPVRLTALLGQPEHQTPERQAAILKQLHGIASLHEYFRMIGVFAMQGEKGIGEGEANLEELRRDDLGA